MSTTAASRLKHDTLTSHRITEKMLGRGIFYADEKVSPLAAFRRLIVTQTLAWKTGQEWLVDFSPHHLDLGFVPILIRALEKDRKQLDLPEQYNGKVGPSPISDHSSLIGVAYVFRGSTLGGKQINRLLSRENQLPSSHFYRACAESLPPGHWPAFLHKMNTLLDTKVKQQSAISAARDTFTLFQKAYGLSSN